MKTLAISIAFGCAASLVAGVAPAQDRYPSKPVRVVVPLAAGGATSQIIQFATERLEKKFGQRFVIENRPGGLTRPGTEAVTQAAPDGYTLLGTGNLVTYMDLVYGADFPVRADRDLTAVALVGGGGLTIIAPASLPANNLRELVGYARANPGKLNVGVGGAQSPGMLALWTRLGIRPQLTDVLYKGGQPAVQATVANEIQLFGSAPMDALEFIRAGRLKALAHFDNARYPQLPDVPAVSEAGIAGIDGTEARFYAGIWGPAKLSEGIVTTLNAAFVEATRSPEARERFGNFGMQPYPYGLAEVRQAHAGQRRIVEELLAQGVSLR